MRSQTLIMNGCWAVAVVAAFGVGSLRRGPAGEPQGSGVGSKGARATGIAGESAGGGRLAPGGPRGAGAEGSAIRERLGIPVLSGADLEALALQAVRDSNPITRRLAFARLLESLTPANAMAMREQLVALGADRDQWRDFNFSWGALAGREAFDFAGESEERDLEAVLTGWSFANPAEALALIDNLPESMRDDRRELAESVVAGMAGRDRALATDLVLRLTAEDSDGTSDLIRIVANEAMRNGGPAEAAAWSESLPAGPVKGAAMERVAGEFAERDLEGAALWAARFAQDGFAAGAVERVSEEWAEESPVGAANWLQGLPTGPGQSEGLRSVFGDWEDRDPVAAGEYLLAMPDSAQRDSAISGFSNGYAWQDPQTALAWAEHISDPELRQESLTRAGQAFFRRDPDSARAWLETSALPPDAQQAILNPPRRR